MQDFINKKILLGICGGIAAFKSAYLIRELTRLGAEVRVVMTDSAQQFMTPLTLQALSGHEVRTELFDSQAERAMGHIELARWADYLIIAPASANCLAKLAHGLADDLLSTLYLVIEAPVFICPAMNQSMWKHQATQENFKILKDRGHLFIGPDEGIQACGEHGFGRLSEVEQIINTIRLHTVYGLLRDYDVLITAGPTREALDPVRYLSNYSSGKMGYALAQAAAVAGAKVTLISGPTVLPIPPGVKFYSVNSATEMHAAVMKHLSEKSIFIGCAAVADYRPVTQEDKKIKKQTNESLNLKLILNPDIVFEVAQSKKARYVVGFAAETNQVIEHAKQKLSKKQLNMIIANQVGPGLGFDSDDNEVTILTAESEIALTPANKIRLAGQIIEILAATIQNDNF
ncbi:DNA/pantothenate metabolism flavoprotein [Legionella beliardensis]|uniref:Coenzyme A biosynthesis bifunctional protein CoaBC n=1 Tax=Legionella beliardensis TaxID=91822 RepID=A0A378HYA7_9GAMM|nr:bifunctional phosphopantothenoylcysteine decarboxylase/phosphopantothenate--cysteine ligase CoaBC [Legionella beliardensis]STX27877.1 DNA/pantothenate metabolism flavoprotein [Legionella beliardensis]